MNSLQQKLDENNSKQNLHQNNNIDMNDQHSTSDINHPIDGYTHEQHKRLLHRVDDTIMMEDERPQHRHRKLYTIENPRSNIIQQNQQDMATNVVEQQQNNQDIDNIIIDQPVEEAVAYQPTTIDIQYQPQALIIPRHLQRDQEPLDIYQRELNESMKSQESAAIAQEQFEKNVQSMFGIGQQQTETADNQYYTQQSYDPFATDSSTLSSQASHDVNTSAFLTAFYVNIVVFIVLIGCYELFRKWFPSVYSPRTTVIGRSTAEPSSKRNSDKVAKGEESDSERSSTSSPSGLTSFNVAKSIISNRVNHIINTSRPLSWIPGVCRASWSTVRSSGGLDSYMFLRYVRLCFRITFTSALWGLIILWPVYATADGGANGWYFLSMANITQESRCFI